MSSNEKLSEISHFLCTARSTVSEIYSDRLRKARQVVKSEDFVAKQEKTKEISEDEVLQLAKILALRISTCSSLLELPSDNKTITNHDERDSYKEEMLEAMIQLLYLQTSLPNIVQIDF